MAGLSKMYDSIEQKLLDHPKSYLTDTEFQLMFGGSDNRRYSKIKRLLKQGKLIHIRRGLYVISMGRNQRFEVHPFELSQFIYGPSYVSFQSALEYYQLIPEAVITITCATGKRSKQFNTPLGIFDYQHLPEENFYCEVKYIKESQGTFLIAKPWKAICDYVYCYKKEWNSLEPLEYDLRIDIAKLPPISDDQLEVMDEYYHRKRLSNFLKMIKEEFNVYRNCSATSA